jgi:hypothetical protein
MYVYRVGPWFPRAPSECKEESDKFFSCFAAAGEGEDPSKAIETCKDSMKVYDACMLKWTKKNPNKAFRVAEQYQAKEK